MCKYGDFIGQPDSLAFAHFDCDVIIGTMHGVQFTVLDPKTTIFILLTGRMIIKYLLFVCKLNI